MLLCGTDTFDWYPIWIVSTELSGWRKDCSRVVHYLNRNGRDVDGANKHISGDAVKGTEV